MIAISARLLIVACAAAVSVASVFADSLPRDSAAAPLSNFGAPGQCPAFRIGLTPEAAERERRAEARREVAAREAERTALELRAYVVSKGDPLQPTMHGTTLRARSISAAELEQAGAHLGRSPTPAVLAANAVLNATAARRYYFYDPEGRLIAETEVTSGNAPRIQYEYVWFGDMPLAQIEEPASGPPVVSYYFADHLGTPILQTNVVGQVVWRAEYEPFGGIYDIRAGESKYQPLRLPGQIADIGGAEPDVYYNVHRFYRASWGRYTQPDPLTNLGTAVTLRQFMGDDAPTPDPAEPNWYDYVGNNPLGATDPLGLVAKPYSLCEVTGDVIRGTVTEGETRRPAPGGYIVHRTRRIVRRECFFRCYCDEPDTCYRRPCLDPFCHLERYHGIDERIVIYNKSGVRPCKHQLSVALAKGKCL